MRGNRSQASRLFDRSCSMGIPAFWGPGSPHQLLSSGLTQTQLLPLSQSRLPPGRFFTLQVFAEHTHHEPHFSGQQHALPLPTGFPTFPRPLQTPPPLSPPPTVYFTEHTDTIRLICQLPNMQIYLQLLIHHFKTAVELRGSWPTFKNTIKRIENSIYCTS